MLRIGAIFFMIFALFITGCQQAAQKVVETTTGVKVDEKKDSVTIKGADGQELKFSSETPAELKDFPVPSGYKLDSSGSMSSGADKLSVASWKGTSTVKEVVDFYTKAMPQAGWKEVSTFASDDGGLYNYSKGDTEVTVTVSKETSDISISVLLSKSNKTPTATRSNSTSAGGTPTSTSSSSSSANSTATPAKPVATATPAGPELTDVSALGEELRAIPMPSGFGVVKGSVFRNTSGGKFQSASGKLFGKTSVKDVTDFYKRSISSSTWDENSVMTGDLETYLDYTNVKNENLNLSIIVQKEDAGTTVILAMTSYE